MGQSSSVMLDQKIHIITTAQRLKKVSKSPPLIAPFVPLQMYLLITYWKICPRAKSIAAETRYTAKQSEYAFTDELVELTYSSASSRLAL